MSEGLHRLSAEWLTAAGRPAEPWLVPGLRRLGRDRLFRLQLLAAAVVLLPYLGGVVGLEVPASYRDGYAFVALGLATALLLARGGLVARDEMERRLHFGAAAAFLCWALAEALESAVWNGETGGLAFGIDVLYLAFYAALVLATDDARRWRPDAGSFALRRLEHLELAVFLGGLLLYFAFVPARLDPEGYLSAAPSAIFYLWLDALLLIWLAWSGRHAVRARERWRWTALRASAVLLALADGLDLLALAGHVDLSPTTIDALWFLPFVTVAAAIRVGPAEAGFGDGAPDGGDPTAAGPHPNLGWALAALLPLGHLVTESTGGLGVDTEAARRGVAGAATAVLVGLALLHERRLARLERRLLAEVEAVRARDAAGSRLAAIGTLAGGVAHDFRQLVEQIHRHTAAFAARELDTDSRRDIAAMARAVERASALTHELLAVGQREPPQRREVDLRGWLLETAPALRELCGERVELALDLGAAQLRCAVDPDQLERVATNLAANARDAMAGGGRLAIRLERRGAEHAVIRFDDQGSGMDRATLERVFEPFFTTKTERIGHGLGLATALGLVRGHGGDIQVTSAPGRGSTFEVVLPLGEPGTPAAPR